MSKNRWLIIFLFCLIGALNANQLPYHFYTLNLKDGLSQLTVVKIYQDSKGFMWFATRNGLNKYDGNSFTLYKHQTQETGSLSHNHITDLLEDGSGNLWIGTISGLNRLDLTTNRITVFDREKTNQLISIKEWINSIYLDRQSRLWIATNIGLFYFHTTTETFHAFPLADENHHTISLYQDSRDNIWVGTQGNGLYLYDRDLHFIHHYSHSEGSDAVTENHISVIYEDSRQQIWVGTKQSGLNKIDPFSHTVSHYHTQNSGIGNNHIRSILEYENQLIIGTFDGLSILDYTGNTVDRFTHFESNQGGLGHFSVYSSYVDNANTFWVGTYAGGVSFSNPLNSRFLFHEPGRASNTAFGIFGAMAYQEKEKKLWIATEGGGLLSLDTEKNTFHHYLLDAQPENRNNQNILKSLLIENDIVWCGTNKGTVYRFDTRTKKFSLFHSFGKDISIYTITRTSDGALWVGTAGAIGLYRFSPDGHIQHSFPLSDSSHLAFGSNRCFFEIEPGVYLSGTHNGGITHYNSHTQTVIRYNIQQEEPFKLLSDYISDIVRDANGNIWIATIGGGFYLFDKEQGIRESYTTAEGLPDDNIYSIICGEDQKLWLSTGKGISSFNPQKKEFVNYTDRNEIQVYEFTMKGGIRLPNNRIYFSGNEGIISFLPDYIRKNDFFPPVVLTALTVNNQDIQVKDTSNILQTGFINNEIRLKHNQNNFSIKYAALNYIFPNQNKYAYKLEGYDKEWNYVENRKEAFYTNLKPGRYIFHVRGSNNDGLWNNTGESISIQIIPPVWATWYAYLFYTLVVCGITFTLYYYFHMKRKLEHDLIEKQKEQQRQEEFHQSKIRMFTNFSHELRTPLMLVIPPLEEILQRVDLAGHLKSTLQMVFNNTQRLLLLVNQLMDLRKNESGNMQIRVSQNNLYLFTQEIFVAFNQIAAQNQIRFKLESDTVQMHAWFDRSLLEKVIFNLLSNAFKHTSQGDTVTICLEQLPREAVCERFSPDDLTEVNLQSNRYVYLSVKDTGKGIPDAEKQFVFTPFFQGQNEINRNMAGTGIGLSLVLSIIKLHQGKIWIEDNQPKGSAFCLLLPVDRAVYTEEQIIAAEPIPADYTETTLAQLQDMPVLKQRYQILLAEDNEEVRTYVKQRLEPYFDVLEAENGKIAFDRITESIPDLVVSDIMMPEMDGLQLCSRIKEDMRTGHIPVIIMTAKSMVMHIKEGYQSGADDYIVKPFNMEVLLFRIHNILAARERLRELYGRKFSLESLGIETSSADDRFMQRFFEVIEQYLDNPDLNVDLICKEIGMGRATFYRKLKALTDLSPVDLIRNKRLEIAAKMLVETTKNISEISFLVGFNSTTYFSTCFKNMYGISASEYSLQHKPATNNTETT
ncbi:hybrid sensor histidine kinase/response regulator [Parabacteroides sp. 52]|uniref:hybrid sensor histidine kinase/response regulator transcription factor n=1 Tax=unclassified Parabacteroides TaxID=2649774 RepID=UPI0013D8B90B|nr:MULTISPECIES: hybrid sensor histidine kinase/response regulator transcription factor [unclassified Parabacteroides]MDH6534164.1 signal transduction histidine kinase/ligand-binding sensor domain-containing protein/CheY-like chemotaxis protein [Parabacteroides sp. PM5-20]NDV54934.1 hybrid sensor histidine kinase/response regulator [Parabacteroides sp. 52]